jgi:hypothetical protein
VVIEVSCHCGSVRMQIDVSPETVTECNCSICRKKGVLWAYYAPAQVRISAPDNATSAYRWNDEVIEFHTCRTCGCTTHYVPTAKPCDRVAVNARLMDPDILAAAAVRKFDGARLFKLRDQS